MTDYPLAYPVEEVLARASEFHEGRGAVHRTAEALAKTLREDGIAFAIAGALALGAHGVRRDTEDVDVLITRDGLARFKEKWLGRGYVELRPGGKPVRDTQTKVKIDFLLTGEFPGDGRPKPVAFPDPTAASVSGGLYDVLSLPKFVELKLASGMTAKDRPRDLDDVIRLIRVRKLPRELEDELDAYVRPKFVELWGIAQAPEAEY